MNDKPVHIPVALSFHTPRLRKRNVYDHIRERLETAERAGQSRVRLTAEQIEALCKLPGWTNDLLLSNEPRKRYGDRAGLYTLLAANQQSIDLQSAWSPYRRRLGLDIIATCIDNGWWPDEVEDLNDFLREDFEMPLNALIIDTETAAAATPYAPGFEDWRPEGQALTFGRALRARWDGERYIPKEEFLFYADGLPAEGVAALAAGKRASVFGENYETDDPPNLPLKIQPLSEFLEEFGRRALSGKFYVVGLNLAFDLSRLAYEAVPARGEYHGGFTFRLWRNEDGTPNEARPVLKIKRLDNTKTLFGWGSVKKKGTTGRRDYDSLFIDVRTLLYALTYTTHSLKSAAKAYLPPEDWKGEPEMHGVITEDYITYNRQDCYTTLALLNWGLAEWSRVGVDTPPHRLYSPASLVKGALSMMGVKPRLSLQPDFSDADMGKCMQAYYGGRVETMIRKIDTPVVYTDFLSNYMTVNCLMGLWSIVTAEQVRLDEATDEIQNFLDNVTADDLFDKDSWPKLRGYALLQPDGDVLPVRGRYAEGIENIGINPYWGPPQWYSLPDLVAAKLLGNKTPRIIQGLKLTGIGRLANMRPITLRGRVTIDPYTDDLFRALVEERYKVKKGINPYEDLRTDEGLTDEGEALQATLKCMGNAGGYGVFVQRDKKAYAVPSVYTVYSGNEAVKAKFDWYESPGVHYFPPVAALITGAARLLLAMLEVEICQVNGGAYVTCDTDSFVIAADEHEREFTFTGAGADGTSIEQTIKLLAWSTVDSIISKFASINPYPSIPGSILKIEDENYRNPRDKSTRRRVWCYSISAKRYRLADDNGNLIARKESGLADFDLPLLLPGETKALGRKEINTRFIDAVWLSLGDRAAFDFWGEFDQARSRSVSKVAVWGEFKKLNEGRAWRDQIKPFNFFRRVSCFSIEGDDIASVFIPFEGSIYDIYQTKTGQPVDPATLVFKPVEHYLLNYFDHPEKPYFGPDGLPCSPKTRGQMRRRPVAADKVYYIGKEVPPFQDDYDLLEETQLETVSAVEPYLPPALEVLQDIPSNHLALMCGVSTSVVRDWFTGRKRPARPADVIRYAVEHARALVGVDSFSALDEYPVIRSQILAEETLLVAGLSLRDIQRRYECSPRQADRYKAGRLPPFRKVLEARRRWENLLPDTGAALGDPDSARVDLFYWARGLRTKPDQRHIERARAAARGVLAGWGDTGLPLAESHRRLLAALASGDDDTVWAALETTRDGRLEKKSGWRGTTRYGGERFTTIAEDESIARLRESRQRQKESM